MLDTPVLFIIFNRPETTSQVFETIRKAKPLKLFVAADGPRENNVNEKQLCEITRSIIQKIDWDCEVKTLFRDENLGCGKAVSEAITWFFNHVEHGIILEDDCLPLDTFFNFCEILLQYYKNDSNIFGISGLNIQFGQKRGNGSYYFSKYGNIWGWATWKRAWNGYDFNITDYPEVIHTLNVEPEWHTIFHQTYNKTIDTWDYQWVFHVFRNKGKIIVPNQNLILNIGFGLDATHTKSLPNWHKKYKLNDVGIDLVVHPINTEINKKADKHTFNLLFKSKRNIKSIIRKTIIKIIGETQFNKIKSRLKNK
jgi:hypothetical protein